MASIFKSPKTYLDLYNQTIAPKLIELDLFLKEAEIPITLWQASQVLDMPYDEVKAMVNMYNISRLDYSSIFILILGGSSRICRLIQKEALLGFPAYYTATDISYIYEIEEKKVDYAFKRLGLDEIKCGHISDVFELLPL